MKIDKKKLIAGILTLVIAACSYVVTEYLREDTPAVSGEGLTVQYIDVGQADCALLECDGEFLLIDGGNRDDSQLVVSFLEQQGVKELAAVVCSHAHEDHVGGLPAVLAVYPTKAVYAPTKTYSSNIFDKFVYYTDQQGLARARESRRWTRCSSGRTFRGCARRSAHSPRCCCSASCAL